MRHRIGENISICFGDFFFFKDGILLAEIAVEAEKDKLELKLFSVYRGTRKTVS